MLLPSAASAKGLDVALLGIPYDGGTSYRTGARFGPRAVREQSSLIRPWNPVLKVHPFERLRIADCGDVDTVPISIERTLAAIDARVSAVIAEGAMPVCVGGDHSVTLGILRALARRHGRLAWCTSTRIRTRGMNTSARSTSTGRRFAEPSRKGSSTPDG